MHLQNLMPYPSGWNNRPLVLSKKKKNKLRKTVLVLSGGGHMPHDSAENGCWGTVLHAAPQNTKTLFTFPIFSWKAQRH